MLNATIALVLVSSLASGVSQQVLFSNTRWRFMGVQAMSLFIKRTMQMLGQSIIHPEVVMDPSSWPLHFAQKL